MPSPDKAQVPATCPEGLAGGGSVASPASPCGVCGPPSGPLPGGSRGSLEGLVSLGEEDKKWCPSGFRAHSGHSQGRPPRHCLAHTGRPQTFRLGRPFLKANGPGPLTAAPGGQGLQGRSAGSWGPLARSAQLLTQGPACRLLGGPRKERTPGSGHRVASLIRKCRRRPRLPPAQTHALQVGAQLSRLHPYPSSEMLKRKKIT